MQVKLTQREPDAEQREQGHQWLDWCGVHDETPEAASGWRTMHDAAPDDATRALVNLLWAIQQLRHGPNSEYAVHARYVDTYLGKFAQTDEGAALIRQEEERDDAAE